MKKLIVILIFICSTLLNVNAQSELAITVNAIDQKEGSLMVGLFDSKEDFPRKASYGKVVRASEKRVTVVFENLAPGAYAISVVHDRNNNGKLDTNRLGIPKEGFVFGNNAMGLFGPPSFVKAMVVLDTGVVRQELFLKYY